MKPNEPHPAIRNAEVDAAVVTGEHNERAHTLQQKSHERIAAAELRYRRLFESAQDGILILDAKTGLIVDVNPFLIDLLGFSREAFLDKKVWELGFFKDIAANEDKFAELRARNYVRYADLPLKTADGRAISVEFVSNVYLVDEQKVIQCNIRDITAHKQAEGYREMSRKVLELLNEPGDLQTAMQRVIATVREGTGCDAVGLRLQDGEDFPYFAQQGFSEDFLLTEDTLLGRGTTGEVCRDKDGNANLECTCGMVIGGKTDPTNPLFTRGGSFWTNDSRLLDLPRSEDPRLHPRNQCMRQGYASLALVPIRNENRVIGLIQLNYQRKGCLTLDTVGFLEGIASHIGATLMRKRAEKASRESERHFRILFNHAADVILQLEITPEGIPVIRDANNATLRLLGYDRARLIGQPVSFIEAMPPVPEAVERSRRASLARMGRTFEVKHRCKDGTVREFECSVTEMHIGPKTLAISVERDISDRKRLERERIIMQAQLIQSQKLESIGTLASGVAHEINNPIMGIMNYAQLILDQLGPDSPVAEFATEIGKESQRVATIVRNLLAFAREDRQSSSPARLCDIVAATLSLIHTVMRIDQVELTVDVPADLPPIQCRSQQIQQVIMNLITNARDALNQRYPKPDANKKIILSANDVSLASTPAPTTEEPPAPMTTPRRPPARTDVFAPSASRSKTTARASRRISGPAFSTRSSPQNHATRARAWGYPSAMASSKTMAAH